MFLIIVTNWNFNKLTEGSTLCHPNVALETSCGKLRIHLLFYIYCKPIFSFSLSSSSNNVVPTPEIVNKKAVIHYLTLFIATHADFII